MLAREALSRPQNPGVRVARPPCTRRTRRHGVDARSTGSLRSVACRQRSHREDRRLYGVQDFSTAATRHCRDAAFLEGWGRLPNADHLAGFATECALKEILIRFLGARSTNGRPFSVVAGTTRQHGHLPQLWYEVANIVSGRAASTAFANLLSLQNPFATWSVNDRYEDGADVTAQAVATRLAAARQILGHLQNAITLGVLR
jgi:hypothetical protein